MTDFEMELRDLINRHSMENGSDTPDFILAEFMFRCLLAFDMAVDDRDKWNGRTKDELLKVSDE